MPVNGLKTNVSIVPLCCSGFMFYANIGVSMVRSKLIFATKKLKITSFRRMDTINIKPVYFFIAIIILF